jgi:predicted phage-related endonuclease
MLSRTWNQRTAFRWHWNLSSTAPSFLREIIVGHRVLRDRLARGALKPCSAACMVSYYENSFGMGPTCSLLGLNASGGSDARIIMGKDEKALLRLWKEKRGEVDPPDLSDELIVQLGLVTEDLNRRWYERNSGYRIEDIQRRAIHRSIPWMAATLDGLVKETGAIFEAKFMLPWSFSEEAAAEKHMAQLQHSMFVAGTRKSVLSIINGGGKWVELSIHADPIYQTILIAAEKAFWSAVKTGEPPALFDCESPKPRIEAVRVVDMTGSNSWADFAALFRETRSAHAEHERAKNELKGLMPEDAKEAMGHGLRAKRSKSGAVSFDLLDMEASHASLQ